MLERLLARVPALMLLGVIVLALLVFLGDRDEPRRLVCVAPAALVLLAYLQAGRSARGGGGRG